MLTSEPFGLPDIETKAGKRHVRVVRLFDRFGVASAFDFSSGAHVLRVIEELNRIVRHVLYRRRSGNVRC